MPKPVISVEHLSKQYDLGVISTGTLTRALPIVPGQVWSTRDALDLPALTLRVV